MEWRASHILVKDQTLARDLVKRAKQGADFAALAREYSTCPSKGKGGDLGWFGAGKMVPEFERACSTMGIGSVSEVVNTQFGFHVIKLTGRK